MIIQINNLPPATSVNSTDIIPVSQGTGPNQVTGLSMAILKSWILNFVNTLLGGITQGPPGPAGATGPQGLQGPAGPQGAQGMLGLQGPTGAQGLQGLTGATGTAGPPAPLDRPEVSGRQVLLVRQDLLVRKGQQALINYQQTLYK